MGQVRSKLVRPFRNFNIDNRAAKVLERRQTVAEAAPKHPTTSEVLTRLRDEHPEFLEAQKTKHEKLNENLKHVYVTSKDESEKKPETSQRSLPLARKPPEEADMGSLDPAYDVPEGRVSLKNVIGFLGQFQTDKENVTAAKIAQDYRLDEQEVQNVLSHFKVLQLHIPKEMYEKNKNLVKIMAEQMKSDSIISPTLRLAQDKKQVSEGSESRNKDNLSPTKS